MLFDLRKSHLRCISTILRVMLFWPFISRYAEMEAGIAKEVAYSSAERLEVTQRAKDCLQNCVSYIANSKALLMQKCIVSHVTLRGYIAIIQELQRAFAKRFQTVCGYHDSSTGFAACTKGNLPGGRSQRIVQFPRSNGALECRSNDGWAAGKDTSLCATHLNSNGWIGAISNPHWLFHQSLLPPSTN
jgi:hypothetical protein